tara:strand:+ start:1842 stop:2486 length:645 start_codon:yes stop_codon:yes gene_type:complete
MLLKKIFKKIRLYYKSFKTLFFHDFIKQYPHFESIDYFLSTVNLFDSKFKKSLDIGCGRILKNPFSAEQIIGIDLIDFENVIKHDVIANKLPFEDNKFDCCTAFDFLEHVPRVIIKDGKTYFPFIELISDIYRILKPNGLFLHVTPAYPSKFAFQDPTHVNVITENTFPKYFCSIKDVGKRPKAIMYGFKGDFILLKQGWLNEHWVISLLKAEK